MPLSNLGKYESNFNRIKDACEKLWKKPHHYHYTEHGPGHSENIIESLSDLLSGQGLKLKPIECFILSAACYLHDVGMQCIQNDLLKKIAGVDDTIPYTYENLEKIREKHADLSYIMIKNIVNPQNERYADLPDLGLYGVDNLVVDAIAGISKAHSDNDFHNYCQIADTKVPGCRGGAKMRLLAVLMRLGDALDADRTRCDWESYVQMEASLTSVSKAHFWKHYWVSGVNIENSRIRLTFVIPEKYNFIKQGICDMAESYIRIHKEDQEDIWRKYNVRIGIDDPEFPLDCPEAPQEMPDDVVEYFAEYSGIMRIPESYKKWVIDHCKNMDITKLTERGNVIQVKLPEIFTDCPS